MMDGAFTTSEQKKIRARVVLLGIIRLIAVVLAMSLLSMTGWVVWCTLIVSVHLHALK
jgi:hypothetical protein